jgi:hypothetical protein
MEPIAPVGEWPSQIQDLLKKYGETKVRRAAEMYLQYSPLMISTAGEAFHLRKFMKERE